MCCVKMNTEKLQENKGRLSECTRTLQMESCKIIHCCREKNIYSSVFKQLMTEYYCIWKDLAVLVHKSLKVNVDAGNKRESQQFNDLHWKNNSVQDHICLVPNIYIPNEIPPGILCLSALS